MPRSEEGAFELTVGTRQLLAVIFILMALFGVVFSMGYFVGRSSNPEPQPVTAAAPPPGAEAGAGKPSAVGALSPAPAPPAPLEPGQAAVTRAAPPPETTQPPAES